MDMEVLKTILGISAVFFAGVYAGVYVAHRGYQLTAISHGAARYNPTTGKFEWLKGKSDE